MRLSAVTNSDCVPLSQENFLRYIFVSVGMYMIMSGHQGPSSALYRICLFYVILLLCN